LGPGTRAAAQATSSVEELSASPFRKYFGGMDYPAGKNDLIGHAKTNDAPDSVVRIPQKFEDRRYRSAADVGQEVG
jgi:hypothetical protein